MRFIVLHVEDTDAQDALTSVLSLPKTASLSDRALAMEWLEVQLSKIHMGPSGPVPEPARSRDCRCQPCIETNHAACRNPRVCPCECPR